MDTCLFLCNSDVPGRTYLYTEFYGNKCVMFTYVKQTSSSSKDISAKLLKFFENFDSLFFFCQSKTYIYIFYIEKIPVSTNFAYERLLSVDHKEHI